jgi:hypothetical protein
VNPFDVERAQAFVHERFELVAERRFLDLVLALKQVERTNRSGFDVLSDGGRRDQRHGLVAIKTPRGSR